MRLGRADPHRADEIGADQRRQAEIGQGRDALAQAVGGAGETAGAEGAGVQPLDRRGVVRMLGSDDEGEGGHGRRPAANARR